MSIECMLNDISTQYCMDRRNKISPFSREETINLPGENNLAWDGDPYFISFDSLYTLFKQRFSPFTLNHETLITPCPGGE